MTVIDASPQFPAPPIPAPPPLAPQTTAGHLDSKGLRLRRHADFQAVYAAAKKQYAKEMAFFFALRSELPEAYPRSAAAEPRIGLTVGKVLGRAHERNRIKRRLRSAIRAHAGLLAGVPVDVVLHPRRTVLTLEWPRLQAEVAQVFRTVRRLLDRPQTEPTQNAVRSAGGSRDGSRRRLRKA